jgi:hypothetical protein
MIKKLLYLFTGFFFITQSAQAQPPYAFLSTSGTYTPIVGGTVATIASGDFDDGFSNALPIGFSFTYNNIAYTTISGSANGWVTFGQNITTTSSTNDLSAGGNRPLLAVLYEDLNLGVNSNFTYQTTGSAGSRVFTLQWANLLWDYAALSPSLSMQLKLYEGTNVIEFVYRQEAGLVALNASGGASIGITTNATGANSYISLSDASANPTLSSTVAMNTIPTRPATGQIYRWSPFCPASTTNTTLEKISNVSFGTINNNSVATTGYENFTAQTTLVQPASVVPVSVSLSNGLATDQVIVFIDYNHNGLFTDPGETVFTSAQGTGPHTGNISIPAISANVLLGPTRMRVRLQNAGDPGSNATACGDASYGQVEDYTVDIEYCSPASITTQPPNIFICNGGGGAITIVAAGNGLTYQWQVSTNGGGIWINLTNTGNYSGVTTSTLVINNASMTMNNYQYRVIINGTCTPANTASNAAVLTINTPAAFTTSPVIQTVCVGLPATYTVAASGSSPTYQWQVSADGGITYNNIPGQTGATLNFSAVTQGQNGNRYRAVATVASCGSVTSSGAILTVNALPVVTLSVAPISLVRPGDSTFVTVGSVPGAVSYTWTRNGVTIAGATRNAIAANTLTMGSYKATVTDINGCVNTSAALTVGAEPTEKVFIYPNPSNGKFTVNLYSPWLSDIRTVNIYNALGSLVASKQFEITNNYMEMKFDLNLAPGFYVVKIVHRYVHKEVEGKLIIH